MQINLFSTAMTSNPSIRQGHKQTYAPKMSTPFANLSHRSVREDDDVLQKVKHNLAIQVMKLYVEADSFPP